MTPVFMTQNLTDTGWSKQVGEDNRHLRIVVKQGTSQTCSGIGFDLGEQYDLIKNKAPFKAVYSLDENEWNGQTSIQLRLRDLK